MERYTAHETGRHTELFNWRGVKWGSVLGWWLGWLIQRMDKILFLILSFRRVYNIVCLLLGDSPASDL
jgi:beta-lactamase class D